MLVCARWRRHSQYLDSKERDFGGFNLNGPRKGSRDLLINCLGLGAWKNQSWRWPLKKNGRGRWIYRTMHTAKRADIWPDINRQPKMAKHTYAQRVPFLGTKHCTASRVRNYEKLFCKNMLQAKPAFIAWLNISIIYLSLTLSIKGYSYKYTCSKPSPLQSSRSNLTTCARNGC